MMTYLNRRQIGGLSRAEIISESNEHHITMPESIQAIGIFSISCGVGNLPVIYKCNKTINFKIWYKLL